MDSNADKVTMPDSNCSTLAQPGTRGGSQRFATSRALLLATLVLAPVCLPGQTTRYWDINNTSDGAGGPSAAGTWSTTDQNWNTDPTGGSSGVISAWAANDDAIFSAGADATDIFKVTIGSSSTTTQYVNSVTVEEGTITFGPGKVALTGTTGVNGTSKFEVKTGASASFSGSGAGYLVGNKGLHKLGGGVLWLGTTEYYTGNTYIDGGACYAKPPNTTSYPFGTGSPTIFMDNGGAIIGSTPASGTTVFLRSAYTLSLSAGGGALGAFAGLGLDVAGKITGAGMLTVSSNLVVLHGTTSDYSGGTVVSNSAVIQLKVDAALGLASAGVTLDNGCIKNDVSNTAIGSARTITLGSNHGYLDAGWGDGPGGSADDSLTIDSLITGLGQLRINIDGSPVVLSNTGNNYAGDTVIGYNGPGCYAAGASAWLQLAASDVIPDGTGKGNCTIDGTYKGLLDLAGYSEIINGLSGNGTVDNTVGGASTLTVGNNNQTSQFDGVIQNTSGTVGLTKVGSGVLTLTGINPYTGSTTISNGTLLVNGHNGPGTVVVEAGALGGNGIIDGAVTVNAGGTFSPGTSIGTLMVNNDLTLRGNTVIEVDRDARTNDFVGGINLLSAGGTVTVSNLGSSLQAGDTFRVFSANTYSGSFAVSGAGATWVLTNGVLAVTGMAGERPVLQMSHAGNTLSFSWSGTFKLQAQTNALGIQLGDSNWLDYPSGSTSPVSVTINPANPSVFFRLRSP
jgi:autotransporter-associated beta strand protein